MVGTVATETPANITDVSSQELETQPGVNIDDRLREVPGFSLFRRTSSVVANPTTQGVSLRGIGSSGSSRTLVLWDGVPVSDPFGKWVYWTRFTPDSIDRIEIVRGASTSVFGDQAMGGAIGIFSKPATHLHFDGGYEAGSENSQDVWLGFADLWRYVAISGSGRAYRTDGYYVVPSTIRGSQDRRANVEFVTGDLRLDAFLPRGQRVFVDFNVLAEDRANGTALTHNSTGLGAVSLHYVKELAQDEISFLAFRTQDQYHSTYSSLSADRNTERLSLIQTVPANGNGADLLWNHHGGAWNLAAGADVNQDRGFSHEITPPTALRISGGTLLQHGEFVQTDAKLAGFRFFLGGRHQFTGEGRQFFNPSAGFAWGRSRWRARGSVYRAFRSPSLNELYRQFRVGNTLTLANNMLVPETLFGAEAGADFVTESGSIRMTAFRNSVGHLITNATLSITPALITRQRQNVPGDLSRGFEFSASHRWGRWRAEGGYLYVDAHYRSGPLIPQVPKHQGSAQVEYERGGTLVMAGVRGYSLQFDDDLNQFRLPGYAALQILAQQRINRHVSANFAVENLLDRQYLTGLTPNPTIGAPRLVRVGIKLH